MRSLFLVCLLVIVSATEPGLAPARRLQWWDPRTWIGAAKGAADTAGTAAKQAADDASKKTAQATEAAKSAAAAAKQAADDASKKKATQATEAAKSAAQAANSAATAAKQAADDASKSGAAASLKLALQSAGVCPMLVASKNSFVQKSVPDLVTKLSGELLGPCKDLTSKTCASFLADTSATLLVDQVEVQMGVKQAKEVVSQCDKVLAVVKKSHAVGTCKSGVVDGVMKEKPDLKAKLPDDVKKSLATVTATLEEVQKQIKNVDSVMAPATSIIKLWDSVKSVVQTATGSVAGAAIEKLMPLMPDDVAKATKDHAAFEQKMNGFMKEKLDKVMTDAMGGFCTNAASANAAEGGKDLGASVTAIMDVKRKVQDKVDETTAMIKNGVDAKLASILADMTKSEAGEGTAGSVMLKAAKDIQACADKEYGAVALYLQETEARHAIEVSDMESKGQHLGAGAALALPGALAALAAVAALGAFAWSRRRPRDQPSWQSLADEFHKAESLEA